jgi:hypothetical protein
MRLTYFIVSDWRGYYVIRSHAGYESVAAGPFWFRSEARYFAEAAGGPGGG